MPEQGSTRIALVGSGKMGKALAALAPERGCEVVAILESTETRAGISAELLHGAAVAIEFTEPTAAVDNAIGCIRSGCPVVIGTTGWRDDMPRLVDAVREFNGRVLWSPNFSMGVQLFLAIAEDAARRVQQVGGFDAHIVETHHAAKKDAPSGTAIAIESHVAAGLGHGNVGISSVRVGHVPGTHEVLFDAAFEQIRLVHEARDRRVFADGALRAARWLSAPREPGIYTMRDLVHGHLTPEQ